MITTFFIQIAYSFLSFLVGLLPVGGSIPTSWVSAVQTLWYGINAFSFIVPVATLVSCLAIAMAFHLFVFAWKFLHWLWALIRGSKIH